MIRRIFVLCIITFALILQPGCSKTQNTAAIESCYQEQGVTLIDKGNYFEATLDFTGGFSHKQVGEAFARGILKLIPDYEALVDSYIAENINKNFYQGILSRVYDLKPQLQQDYLAEIEGMASVFSGGEKNVRKDNKISKDEFLLFNLFPDVFRGSQCCIVSVFGPRSGSHNTITGRNLDWFGGSKNQLPRIQAVIKIINPQGKICSLGYLGFMGLLSGFNDHKVFAGILDSQSGAPYTSKGKCSYTLALRFALENKTTLAETAAFMKDNALNYTVNHLISFSDPQESKILENNFSGKGPGGQNAQSTLRGSDSGLNGGVKWDIKDAIGCVNSFISYGNVDNHTKNPLNTKRWANMKTQLLAKGSTVTFDEMKTIISFNHGSPGALSDSGDLYNKMTLQMVVFQPESFTLEVFFRPQGSIRNPAHPVFEKIRVF